MPPNRKSPTLFTSSYELESLKIPLQAKFLPLTNPRESAQQQQKCVQHKFKLDPKTEKPKPTVSYWDWPSDTVEDERLEAIDDHFSLSRFESNLIADSIRREDSITPALFNNSKDKKERIEEHQSYWDWSNEDVDAMKPQINSQDDKLTQTEDRQCEESRGDYWGWHQNEATEDDCSKASPSHRLHQIVTESRKKFIRQHSHLIDPQASLSDHYWHWLEFRSTGAK